MATRRQLAEACKDARLYFDTYSPGDGKTRYRFFETPTNYFANNGIFWTTSIKEALAFAEGFRWGREAERRER